MKLSESDLLEIRRDAELNCVGASVGDTLRLLDAIATLSIEIKHMRTVPKSMPDNETILQIFADHARHSDAGDKYGYCVVREAHALAITRTLFAAAEQPGDRRMCHACFAENVRADHFDSAGKCKVRKFAAEQQACVSESAESETQLGSTMARDPQAAEQSDDAQMRLLDVAAERNSMQRQRDRLKETLERECDDSDWLMRAVGLDAEQCRTDGGCINRPKVRAKLDELDAAEQPDTVKVPRELLQEAHDELEYQDTARLKEDSTGLHLTPPRVSRLLDKLDALLGKDSH